MAENIASFILFGTNYHVWVVICNLLCITYFCAKRIRESNLSPHVQKLNSSIEQLSGRCHTTSQCALKTLCLICLEVKDKQSSSSLSTSQPYCDLNHDTWALTTTVTACRSRIYWLNFNNLLFTIVKQNVALHNEANLRIKWFSNFYRSTDVSSNSLGIPVSFAKMKG